MMTSFEWILDFLVGYYIQECSCIESFLYMISPWLWGDTDLVYDGCHSYASSSDYLINDLF